MKPIINPWLIYLIDLFDNFNGLLTGALIFTWRRSGRIITYLVF